MASDDEVDYENVEIDRDYCKLQRQKDNIPVYENLKSKKAKQNGSFLSSITFWRVVSVGLVLTNICSVSLVVFVFKRKLYVNDTNTSYKIHTFSTNIQTGTYGGITESDIDTALIPSADVTTKSIPRACASSPCLNKGICKEVGPDWTKYFCTCLKGYQGGRCERRNNCTVEPCRNGGSCYDCNDEFRCKCKTGYSGETCEIETSCSTANCKHGSVCVEMGHGYECVNELVLDRLIKQDSRTSYCKKGWLQWSIYCYWISDYRTNWTIAMNKCKEKSAYLLQVKTKHEIDWLQERIDKDVWVGGKLIGNEYMWEKPAVQIAKESSLWGKCQPSGPAPCMQIWNNLGISLLDDTECYLDNFFVCKYKSL